MNIWKRRLKSFAVNNGTILVPAQFPIRVSGPIETGYERRENRAFYLHLLRNQTDTERMKKINITSAVLLVYLIVIGVMAWPGDKPEGNYTEYFLVMGTSFVIMILLRIVQIRRFKMRNKWKEEEGEK